MGFSAPQAARLAGCSPSQVDYWDRCGLIVARPADPDGAYSFRDLVALRMVRSLLDAGLPLALFVAVDQMAADVDAEVRAFSQDRQTFVDRLRGSDHPAGSGRPRGRVAN